MATARTINKAHRDGLEKVGKEIGRLFSAGEWSKLREMRDKVYEFPELVGTFERMMCHPDAQ